MIYRVLYRSEEPLVNGEDPDGTISGFAFRSALVNLFLNYGCPHSSVWCDNKGCPDKERCFVPDQLLGEGADVSFGLPLCPSCGEERLVPLPSTWLICKKCKRAGKDVDFVRAKSEEVPSCPSCSSQVTLEHVNGYVCTGCSYTTTEYPVTFEITAVGLAPKRRSSEQSILFNFSCLAPGYTYAQFIHTKNDNLARFLKDMVGKVITIGGKRNRGFGNCTIIEVKEYGRDAEFQTEELCFVTPGLVKDGEFGGISRQSIKSSNGRIDYIGHFKALSPGQGNFTDREPIVTPGSTVILTDPITITLEEMLFSFNTSNHDGYNSVIPLELFKEEN